MSEERTILNWENDEKRMLSTRRDGRTTSSGASSKFWQVICWPLNFQRARYFFVNESQEVSWPFSSMVKHRSSRKGVTT